MTYIHPAGDHQNDKRVNAMKAIGPVISLDIKEFREMLLKIEEPIVVTAESGFFSKRHNYFTHRKGFYFHSRTKIPQSLPQHCEIIYAKKIWVPS